MKPIMVEQSSTRSAISDPRDKRLGKLHRKRQQFMLTAGLICFLLVGVVVLKFSKLLDFSSKDVAAQPLMEVTQAQPANNLLSAREPDPFEPETEPLDKLLAFEPVENPVVENAAYIAGTETPADVTEPAPIQEPVNLPTQAHLIHYEENTPILYYAQSGDSIGVLAVRFAVETGDITSTSALPAEGFIPQGQLLLIPNRLEQTSSNLKLFPDSEVVNSPSSIGFDTQAFLDQAGGYLATYQEAVYGAGQLKGSEIVDKVAKEFAIHPRLLLALLEHQSGWVYGTPVEKFDRMYPLGFEIWDTPGLYHQFVEAAGIIESGYYGWREGTVVTADFVDGWELRLAAELNCGTVGLMHFFSSQNRFEEWSLNLYGEHSFLTTYTAMFGDPWLIAQQYEPLFTPDVLQPEFILPFEEGVKWTYTVGPHAAWGAADVRAALDFSPPSSAPGCSENWSWVTAVGPGLVVRSESGAVVVDMDGDGFEQTGWNVIYLHIATNARVPVGTWVEAGDRIGHPSCEGGISTGTHLHITRKYNGEWVPAEGPLSFVMSGWKAKAGSIYLSGWLVRADEVVKASIYGAGSSHIYR